MFFVKFIIAITLVIAYLSKVQLDRVFAYYGVGCTTFVADDFIPVAEIVLDRDGGKAYLAFGEPVPVVLVFVEGAHLPLALVFIFYNDIQPREQGPLI